MEHLRLKHSIFRNNLKNLTFQRPPKVLVWRKGLSEPFAIWASMQETLSSGFANNKGVDQPAHPHSLISAFVILFLESITSKVATGDISIL